MGLDLLLSLHTGVIFPESVAKNDTIATEKQV
jgi:hypothetical protein